MVPFTTLTSLWHRPAAWMRTRTSWGRTSRTSTSSRTSSSPVQTMPFISSRSRGSLGVRCWIGAARSGPSALPHDRLHLAVGVQPPRAAVAADAAVLEAAERRLMVALEGVDADVAGLQQLGDRHGPAGVAGEHVVVEAVGAVVGDRDRLVLVVERDGHDDRAEDLLAGRLHLVGGVGQECRRDVVAGVDLGSLAPHPR